MAFLCVLLYQAAPTYFRLLIGQYLGQWIAWYAINTLNFWSICYYRDNIPFIATLSLQWIIVRDGRSYFKFFVKFERRPIALPKYKLGLFGALVNINLRFIRLIYASNEKNKPESSILSSTSRSHCYGFSLTIPLYGVVLSRLDCHWPVLSCIRTSNQILYMILE